MARKKQLLDDPGTDVYATQTPMMQVSSPEPEIPLVNQSPLVADAVAAERRNIVVPPVRRFVLLQGGVFTCRGFRATMRAGKVLDEANYDLDSLRSQGAQLQAVEG